jgi:hypothetical protein
MLGLTSSSFGVQLNFIEPFVQNDVSMELKLAQNCQKSAEFLETKKL